MAKEVDIKKIISNLAKIGVPATLTKSRKDMLQSLASGVPAPSVQPN